MTRHLEFLTKMVDYVGAFLMEQFDKDLELSEHVVAWVETKIQFLK